MKNMLRQIITLMLPAILFACEENDIGKSPAATVNFISTNTTISETATAGSDIKITLSHAAGGQGLISVMLTSEAVYGTQYTTLPAAVNGKIIISVSPGATDVSFRIIPVDDALFNASRPINATIDEVSGALTKGALTLHTVLVTDNELTGMPKSSLQTGGSWSIEKTISYNENGTINKIDWVRSTPYPKVSVDQYVYNNLGVLDKIISSEFDYTRFIYEGGIIIKSESYSNNVLRSYSMFGYDDAGNPGEVAVFYRQDGGGFLLGADFIFLYYTNGNLYKKLAYLPDTDGELYLVTTETYDHYFDVQNPFSDEIIPFHPLQPGLPSTYGYSHALNGDNFNYQFTYEYLADGKPSKRTVTGPQVSDTIIYEYY